ncbi:DHH family phosphoesterase [Cohnella rhizosphaerae]|uniref:DHH family phosphoesterase n=1 Tax=Cohnella rhizosphaerae TaxID=1457232 RepID=A0A9X4QXM7_9BACL|nr:DHH family phosphoesterase [Cohnella rhizosphaerae]MDG0813672.1 DHH family phosphoesterase [Cohnella rhizosphaerae]
MYPGLRDLHDPYLLLGMDRAVARIRQAIDGSERIRVYGDYDADGVTSTALMHRLLSRLGADFDTYIPHRSKEGYGLNLPAIDKAAEAGVKLIVTVDNGISAIEQIAYAATLGIDVVVTDHHEPPAVLPNAAVAIVNPKQPGCPYPFKELTGSAVAFKLAHAMLGEPDLAFADVAAIGVVADLMPLTGENRAIVKLGLEEMNARPSPGIKALAQISGAEPGRLTSGRVAFGLAPRLNAGGRLAEADTALRLLITADQREAELLAAELDMLNQERQQLVEDTLIQADAAWQAIAAAHGGTGPAVIVVAGGGLERGHRGSRRFEARRALLQADRRPGGGRRHGPVQRLGALDRRLRPACGANGLRRGARALRRPQGGRRHDDAHRARRRAGREAVRARG